MSQGPTKKRTVIQCYGCTAEFLSTRSDAKWCADCKRSNYSKLYVQYETMRTTPCVDCGRPSTRRCLRCRACANRQKNGRWVGEKNPSWKGGRHFSKRGYVEVLIAPHTRVLEHRYAWEQVHGPIPKNWLVHHLNGIKTDNRLENLVAMSRSQHHRNHHEPWEQRIRDLEAQLERCIDGASCDTRERLRVGSAFLQALFV